MHGSPSIGTPDDEDRRLLLATPRGLIVAEFEPDDPTEPVDQYDDDGHPAGASHADKIASELQEADELDAAARVERDRGQRALAEANARMARRRAADLRSCEARRRTTATIVPRPRARGQRTRRRAAARHAASGSRGDPDLDAEPEPESARAAS